MAFLLLRLFINKVVYFYERIFSTQLYNINKRALAFINL